MQGGITLGPAVSGHGLTISAYDTSGQLLAQAVLDAQGRYTLNLPAGYTGPVLLRVTDSSEGPDYVDEATGAPRDLDGELRSVAVLGSSGSATAHVTPLTELVIRKLGLGSSLTLGSISVEQIAQVKTKVAQALGLDGVDLMTASADPIIDANGQVDLSRANAYGKLLAALAGMEAGEGQGTDQILQLLFASIDLSTGTLSPEGQRDLVSGARLVAQASGASALLGQVGQTMGLSTAQIDALDSAWRTLLALADGRDNDGMGLSALQLQALGVQRVSEGPRLDALNNVLDVKTAAAVQSRSKLQAWADTVTVVLSTAAGDTAAPTQAELEELGLTDLTPGRTSDLINKIAASPDDGSAVDTLAKLQALVDTTPPTTTVSDLVLAQRSGTSEPPLTNVARQDVSARLSAPLDAGERLLGSIDGGITWDDISQWVSGTRVALTPTLNQLGRILLKVQDAAGNDGPVFEQAYVLDMQAPALAVTQSDEQIAGDGLINAAERSAGVLLSGTSEPGASVGIATGNGASVLAAVDNAGAWTATVPADRLPEGGTLTLTVSSRDTAGNITTATRSIRVDTAAPALGTPAPGISLSTIAGTGGNSQDEAITLSLSFNEPVWGLASGSDSTVFQVGGAGVPATWAGSQGSHTRTLTYTVQTGQNGQAAIDEAAIKAALMAGIRDVAGNAFAYAGSIVNIVGSALPVVDTLAPSLEIETIAEDDVLTALEADQGLTVKGKTSAEDGQTVTVSWGDLTRQATVADGTWLVTFEPDDIASEGIYTITANVADRAGNAAPSAERSLTVEGSDEPDPFPVTLTFDLITDDDRITAQDIQAELTVSGTTDAADGQQVQAYWLDGLPVAGEVSNGTWSVTFAYDDLPEDGEQLLTACIVDANGHPILLNTRWVTVDITPPTTTVSDITLTQFSDGGALPLTRTEEQDITATLSAPLALGEQLLLSLDNGMTWEDISVSASGTSVTHAVTLNGLGIILLKVQDAAGNDGHVFEQTYVLDMQAPDLVVSQSDTEIAGDGVINAAERTDGVLLSGTTEPGASVDIATGTGATIATTADETGAWNATVPADRLPEGGSVTLTITSRDTAGNITTATRSVWLDTLPPEALLQLPQPPMLRGSPDGDAAQQAMGLTEDGFLLCWLESSTDMESNTEDWAVYVQRFYNDGRFDPAVPMTEPYQNELAQLSVVSLGEENGWAVSWHAYPTNGDPSVVFVQTLMPGGTPRSEPVAMAMQDMTYAFRPALAALGSSGDFALVWDALYTPEGSFGAYEIWLQRFAADGTALSAEPFLIPAHDDADGQQVYARVAALGADGAFVVVWRGGESSDFSLVAQRFDVDGGPNGAPLFIEPPAHNNFDEDTPRVMAVGTAGAFVVAYESYDEISDTSLAFLTYVDSTGGLQTFALEAPGLEGASAWSPEVNALDDNRFVLAWIARGPEEETERVCVQRFELTDSGITAEVAHILPAPSDLSEAWDLRISAVGDEGDFLVSWSVWDSISEVESSFVQRFDDEGNPAGAAHRLHQPGAAHAYYPQMLALEDGSLAVSWISGDEDNIGQVALQRLTVSAPANPADPPDFASLFGQGVAFSSADAAQFQGAQWLHAGDTINITLSFSEAVVVNGTPQLGLQVGSETVQANYSSGSASTELVFSYTVAAGQTDPDGILLGELSLDDGAAITDAAGNPARLPDTGGLRLNSGYRVDAVAPTAWLGLQGPVPVALDTDGQFFLFTGAAVPLAYVNFDDLGATLLMHLVVEAGEAEPVLGLAAVLPDGTVPAALPAGPSLPWFDAQWLMEFDAWVDTAWLNQTVGENIATPGEDLPGNALAAVWLNPVEGGDEEDQSEILLHLPSGSMNGLLTIATLLDHEGWTAPQIEAVGGVGDFVITWSEHLSDGSRKVWLQRLNVDDLVQVGADLSATDLSLPSPTLVATQNAPAALAGSDASALVVRVAAVGQSGSFVLAWVGADDDEGLDPDDSIYLQFFSAEGAAQGQPLRIEAPGVTAGSDSAPQLLGLGNDGFALAWRGEDTEGQLRWYLQCFESDGTPRSPTDFGPMAESSGFLPPWPVQMLALGNGDFVMSWIGPTFGGEGPPGVFVQRFSASGQALSDEAIQVEPPEGFDGFEVVQRLPRLAALGDGGAFVLAWTDSQSNLFVQRFDDDGEMAAPATRLGTPDFGAMEIEVSNVQIATLGGDGGYAVTWTASAFWGEGPPLSAVFMQHFNADGSTAQDRTVERGDDVRVASSEQGLAYLVNMEAIPTDLDDIAALDDELWNTISLAAGHSSTELSTEGLALGDYKLYTRTLGGNWSAASEHTLTVGENRTAPFAWMEASEGGLYPTDVAWVESSEKGTAYLMREDLAADFHDALEAGDDPLGVLNASNSSRWNSIAVERVDDEIELPLNGLLPGNYVLYALDRSGLWSDRAENTISLGRSPLFLDALAPSLGITLAGASTGDGSGTTVASAGDFNGDGFDDLLIGSPEHGSGDHARRGLVHIVSGGPALQSQGLGEAFNGWTLVGESAGDQLGLSLAAAGDVNGDGLADVIVGAPGTNSGAGRSYVMFGRSGSGTIDLSDLGSGGFVIDGQTAGDRSGWGVGGGGDVNGDGLADLIVGAPRVPSDNVPGNSHVVYGRTDTNPVTLSDTLGSSQGFVIQGPDNGDFAGRSVAIAGDVNGDGLADVVIGAPFSDAGGGDAGAAVVVFGSPSGSAVAATNLGSQGFVIRGTTGNLVSCESVIGVGDVNGDGLADLGLGVWGPNQWGNLVASESYVVFGQTGTTDVNLGSLGTQGLVIQARTNSSQFASNMRIGPAGDINGDGLADLIVGTRLADGERGISYVVFGQSHGDIVQLDDVTYGIGGFAIMGASEGHPSGSSVHAAGDVDGDGLADLIIGAPGIIDFHAGSSHVIFGSAVSQFAQTAVDHLGGNGADTFNDGGTPQTLVGGAGNDTLIASAASVLYGGAGDDLFVIGQAMIAALQSPMGSGGNQDRLARIDGGSGIDTLKLADGTNLDLTLIANPAAGVPNGSSRLGNIEIIDLTSTGPHTLKLSAADVLDLVGFNAFEDTGRRQLRVEGGLGDRVELGDAGWTYKGWSTQPDLMNYAVWEHDVSLATLYLTPSLLPPPLTEA